jgi:hypothetical protein
MPGRRLLAANRSSTNKRRLDGNTPPASLPSVLPRTTGLVYFLPNASLPGALKQTAVRPNAVPKENRWPPEPSSCDFNAAASTSGSPARLCGACDAMPTSHACGTWKNAVRVRPTNAVAKRHRRWRRRPTKTVAVLRPRLLRCWRRRRQSTKDVAMGRPRPLQRWRHRCWRRRSMKTIAMRRPRPLRCWRRRRQSTKAVAMGRWQHRCWRRRSTKTVAMRRPRPLRCWRRRHQSTKAVAMGRWQHRCWRRRPTKTVAMRRPRPL